MNPKIKAIVVFFICALSVYLVAAYPTLTNFVNSTGGNPVSATNCTFASAGSNICTYIQIPKNSTVTNASVNISGYELKAVTYTGNSWSTSSQDDVPEGITWASPYFYVAGNRNDKIYQYYSNMTYTGNNWPTQDSAVKGITWASPYFYEIGNSGDRIYQYYSNVTYTGNSWSTQDSSPQDITWDGTYLYEIDATTDRIYRYYSNMTYTGNNWPTAGPAPSGITWASPYFYEIGAFDDRIYQYYSNMTYTGNNWPTQDSVSGGITGDGTYLYEIGEGSDRIYQYYANDSYLSNLSIDTGNDTYTDWNLSGEFNSTNSPQSVDLNITAIQNYVDTHTAAADGFVYVPLKISADSAGIAEAKNLLINTDDTATADWLSSSNPSATNVNQTRDWFFVNISTDRNQSDPILQINSTDNLTMTMVNESNQSNSYAYYNATNLADGTYSVLVHVQGNQSPTHTIIIDNDTPTLTLNYPSSAQNISTAEVNFNWTARDGYLVGMVSNLSIDGVVNQSDIATSNTTDTNFTVTLTEGDHNWSVTVWDNLSHTNTSATYSFTIDVTNPQLENISVSGITRTSATVAGDSNELTTMTVDYGISAGVYTLQAVDSTYSLSHSIGLTGLESGRLYYLQITVTDYAGNTNVSTEQFTTSPGALQGGASGASSPSATSAPDIIIIEPTVAFLENQTKESIRGQFFAGIIGYSEAVNALVDFQDYGIPMAMLTVFGWEIGDIIGVEDAVADVLGVVFIAIAIVVVIISQKYEIQLIKPMQARRADRKKSRTVRRAQSFKNLENVRKNTQNKLDGLRRDLARQREKMQKKKDLRGGVS